MNKEKSHRKKICTFFLLRRSINGDLDKVDVGLLWNFVVLLVEKMSGYLESSFDSHTPKNEVILWPAGQLNWTERDEAPDQGGSFVC